MIKKIHEGFPREVVSPVQKTGHTDKSKRIATPPNAIAK
jgi:hypothetical protein